jgi:hypothetical protein
VSLSLSLSLSRSLSLSLSLSLLQVLYNVYSSSEFKSQSEAGVISEELIHTLEELLDILFDENGKNDSDDGGSGDKREKETSSDAKQFKSIAKSIIKIYETI